MSQIGDDLLDLRDLWKRHEELQDEISTAMASDDFDADFWAEEDQELRKLEKLFDEIAPPDRYGEFDEPTLILESYFERYAQDLAEELYEVADHWPFTCIDWEEAAEELKVDYTTYEIDGYTYYQRA